MASSSTTVLCPAAPLEAFATGVVRALGADDEVSREVGRHLVRSNLSGHDSHGVRLLPAYVAQADRGELSPAARPVALRETEVVGAPRRPAGVRPLLDDVGDGVGHGPGPAPRDRGRRRAALHAHRPAGRIHRAGGGGGARRPGHGRRRGAGSRGDAGPRQPRALLRHEPLVDRRAGRHPADDLRRRDVGRRGGQGGRGPGERQPAAAGLPPGPGRPADAGPGHPVGGRRHAAAGRGRRRSQGLRPGDGLGAHRRSRHDRRRGADDGRRGAGARESPTRAAGSAGSSSRSWTPPASGIPPRIARWSRRTWRRPSGMPPAGGREDVLVPGEPERRSRDRRGQEGIPIAAATWAELGQVAARFGVPLPGARPLERW